MIITLNNKELDALDLDSDVYNKYLYSIRPFFNLPSGNEHYRLLIHLSSLFSDTNIFDIGTNEGASAMALATNQRNMIYSYDIVNLLPVDFSSKTNIKFNIFNILDNPDHKEMALKSRLMFLDTAHDGVFEKQFYNFLIDNNYSGILVLDDIHLNSHMRFFWEYIVTKQKYDITKYGHGSGTGIVFFDNQYELKME